MSQSGLGIVAQKYGFISYFGHFREKIFPVLPNIAEKALLLAL